MSLDFVGEWVIRPKNQEDPYPPRTWMLIGRHGTDGCRVAWLDSDGNLCLLSTVPYDVDSRLNVTCSGCRGSEKEAFYDVDIQFGDDESSIVGNVKPTPPPGGALPPGDDPLTGLWTADRRPPGGDP